jgi:hypothetical protein
MFMPTSRYADARTYQVTLPDGSVVTATRIPLPVTRAPIGWHPRAEGERLDLIAYRYLQDPTRFWQLCEANDAVVPDALSRHDLIAIPPPGA